MKPVYQEALDGQCHRACIASLFEVPIDSLPSMGGFPPADYPNDWVNPESGMTLSHEQYVHTRSWLAERGLIHICVPYRDRPIYNERGVLTHREGERMWGLCIASGPSPRGPWSHACVYDLDQWDEERNRRGVLVHDPHPGGTGLETIDSVTVFAVTDPAKMQPRSP